MEIQYLTQLQNYPEKRPNDPTHKFRIKPISLDEIAALELLYNNGRPFPKALKELLFLAGGYCYTLDYGIFDTQHEMQEFVRRLMVEENRVINRPFYAIDVYNGISQFLFIYLDEGDDPIINEGHYSHNPAEDGGDHWIRRLKLTLSGLVNYGVNQVKQGRNPF